MDDKTAACCFDLGAFFVQKCHTKPAVKVSAVSAVAALLKKQRVLSLLWRQKHLGGECLKGSFLCPAKLSRSCGPASEEEGLEALKVRGQELLNKNAFRSCSL